MKHTVGLPKIVITGIVGRLGRLAVKRLHRMGKYHLIGIDRRPMQGLPKDIEHLQYDLRSQRVKDVFRTGDVAALIHLGLMHGPRMRSEELHSWNVAGTARLLDYCSTYGVKKVVVLSSANVYGPRPDNQQFLTEDAPLLGAADFPAIRDLIEADMQATAFFWRYQGSHMRTVVLRPVHILGLVRNAPSNYLRLPKIPVIMGYDPMVQVIHERDVIEAIVLSTEIEHAHGVFNVAGPGEVPLSAILKELNKPIIRIPSFLFERSMKIAWKTRLTSFPVPELAHIRYLCMVDDRRARSILGFKPHYNLRETVRAIYGDEDNSV